MELKFEKAIRKIHSTWKDGIIDIEKNRLKRCFVLTGPRGCGKTKMAQEYIRSHAHAVYISLESSDPTESLKCFCQMYLHKHSDIHNWQEAANAFFAERNGRPALLFIDYGKSDPAKECFSAFADYAFGTDNLCICEIVRSERNHACLSAIFVRYQTPADFCKIFPEYSKQNQLRIYALTDGIPMVMKELDTAAGYEDNVKKLLAPNSGFSTCLPQWLSECFRSPESYYPILASIAGGHHRLSEIAKDVGFPNNKCGKYLEALISNGFVISEERPGGKQSDYYMANSYFASWCRYVYGKKAMQIAAPKHLLDFLRDDLHESVAIPAFHAACERYFLRAQREFTSDFYFSTVLKTEKAVPVKLRDGSMVILDYYFQTDDSSFFLIFPHSLDMRYTKSEVERIYEAIRNYDELYNSHIAIFSLERFSDWCVHESAVNEWFHIVTMERLRY